MEAKPGRKHKRKLQAAISLDKFANLRKSTYDKRAERDKEAALNARKVNKYRKLKARLAGKLQPKVKLDEVLRAEDYDGISGQQQQQQQQQQQDVQQHQSAPSQQSTDAAPQQQQQPSQPRSGEDHSDMPEHKGKRGKKHRPPSNVQRIAAEVQADKEAQQREWEERQRAAAERAAKLAADAKQRSAKRKVLYKRTSHGQPVMKYRVEKMLAQLEG